MLRPYRGDFWRSIISFLFLKKNVLTNADLYTWGVPQVDRSLCFIFTALVMGTWISDFEIQGNLIKLTSTTISVSKKTVTLQHSYRCLKKADLISHRMGNECTIYDVWFLS